MNELIKNIKSHQEKNNNRICNQLINIIERNQIHSEDDLLMFENKFFSTTDINKKIESKYQEYLSDTTHLDSTDSTDNSRLTDYETLFNDATETLDKCKYLLLIYDYINYMLFFPYEAYLLIISDKLQGEYDQKLRYVDMDY